RVGALVLLMYFGLLSWRLLRLEYMRRIGRLLILLLLVQIGIGIANLLLHLPLMLAVAHNFGAALLVCTALALTSNITELPKAGGVMTTITLARLQKFTVHVSHEFLKFFPLCKPRVTALIVFPAMIGMFLATPDMVPLGLLLAATLGIGMASGAA